MPEWTASPPPHDSDKVPGNVDPPPWDQVKPTDPGWSGWVSNELKNCPLPWGPNCRVGIEVKPTGDVEECAVDGANPTNFNSPDRGWEKDGRHIETDPPEPYKDFTRWKRHYPQIRTQRFVEYSVQVRVDCGDGKTWTSTPAFLWKPDGPPRETGPRTAYIWVKTSGRIEVEGPTGTVPAKWKEDLPPQWAWPEPSPTHLGPNEAPPPWMLAEVKIDGPFKWNWRLLPDFKYRSAELSPIDWAPPAGLTWTRIGDVEASLAPGG